jgi:phosphate-selective porin OprO/OprP
LKTIDLRARPEQRDDDPAGNPAGAQPDPNADDSRMIDTGAVVADHNWLTGLEALYVLGPLSLQGEYGWNWVDSVRGVVNGTGGLTTFKGAPQNYVFSGGYVQLAYTLTGESRGYDKKSGTLSRDYFGGRGPFNNAWLVRDEDGHLNWNTGAWELAARYSYTNLNDGTGSTRIQGGVLNGYSAGLNWYLNNVIKLQFEYVYDQRSDVPTASPKITLTNTTIPGFTGGFGMRLQLSF